MVNAPSDFPPAGYAGDYAGFWVIWVLFVAAAVVFFRRRPAAPSRLRLVAGNLLVFLALLWTAVLAGETYLRYVYDTTDSYGFTLTCGAWFKRHFETNADGFRDRDFRQPAEPGAIRIACIGDSFTVGQGVNDVANVWPQRLAAALAQRGTPKYDVRNYAWIGLSTATELPYVEGLVERRNTDHVIVGYCLNDIEDLMPKEQQFDRSDLPTIPWIAPTRSFLADFLWFHLRVRSDPHVSGYFDWVAGAYTDPVLFGKQAAQFQRMSALCTAGGMKLDVVVFPFFSDWGPDYRFDVCHERVAAAWKAAGVNVIDLREACRGIPGRDLVVNRFDAHPNERAQEIAARAILERVFGTK